MSMCLVVSFVVFFLMIRRPPRSTRTDNTLSLHDALPISELRAAGDETTGDAGAEDAEAEQRQRGEHDRHRFVDRRVLATEAGSDLGKEGRTDADDDGEDQNLDAGRDDVA